MKNLYEQIGLENVGKYILEERGDINKGIWQWGEMEVTQEEAGIACWRRKETFARATFKEIRIVKDPETTT